jgi:hypothetical protein
VQRLATSLSQRYGMSAPALVRRLKEGRFCARASLDHAAAERLVGELDALGARSSMSAEGALAPAAPKGRAPGAPNESGLAAAYSGDRLRDDVLDLGALAAPSGTDETDDAWELADIDGGQDGPALVRAQASVPPSGNQTMQMPMLRVTPGAGTPPPPPDPGARGGAPQGTGVRDPVARPRPMVLPPRPPGRSASSDQPLRDDSLPLSEQPTVKYALDDGPRPEHAVQFPPRNGLPPSEQVTVQARPPHGPPGAQARDPFQPPDGDGDTQIELARVPEAPPPVHSAPVDSQGVSRRRAPISVAGSSSIHGSSMVGRLRAAVAGSARSRFVAGVVVAFMVGLMPAQLYSWASAETAYDDIRADLQADYDAADTPQRWAALSTARESAVTRALARQQRLAVSTCLLWLVVAGATAFVWFRFVVPQRAEWERDG